MTTLPPNSPDSEEYLLSVCLQSTDALDLACEYVAKEDFYKPSNGNIFDAMVEMRLAGEAVDIATLAAKGINRDYLHHLWEVPSLISHTKDYAQTVASTALRRRIVQAGRKMAEEAAENTDAEAVVDECESLLYSVMGKRRGDGPVPLRELLRDAEVRIDDARAGKAQFTLKTHLGKLNDIIIGLGPGTFNILAARPGVGKTALALEIAAHAAMEHRVAFFSVEMGKGELVDRLLSSTSHVPLTNLRAGKVTEQEQARLHEAVADLAEARLYIDDTSSTMSEIHRRVRRLSSKGPLGLVVIDYIQLLSAGRDRYREDSRQNEVARISGQIKLMSKEFSLPVLALSQLNRPEKKYEGEKSKPQKPTLASLRESGALEQDADQVWFLHRNDEMSPEVELIVAKNRSGPVGRTMLHFIPHLTKFMEA